LEANSNEINLLIKAYNGMVDELEKCHQISEREEAWREMAKQVAHEIKNPLTPMRLTVQSFQRKFDPTDPNVKQK
jgi:nitrogen fixation/metabolism regulation signal transduction histidine kinase